jgi:phenylalanyl-tRNA synthetase beta chain
MRAPINWIRDFVPITLPIKELAEKLTMAGLEVEGIETSGHQWQNVVISPLDRFKNLSLH